MMIPRKMAPRKRKKSRQCKDCGALVGARADRCKTCALVRLKISMGLKPRA